VEPDQKNLQSKEPVEPDQWSLWNLEGEQKSGDNEWNRPMLMKSYMA